MATVSETPNLQNLQSIPYDKLTFKHERTEDFLKKKHNTFSHPPPHTLPPPVWLYIIDYCCFI